MKLGEFIVPRSAFASRTQAFLALLASCFLGIAMCTASAQSLPQMDPYSPDGSPLVDNYKYDNTYAAGGVGVDRFSDSSSKNYFGQRIARLDNGDVVVAGLVPRSGGFSVANQIGLVKYSPTGRRLTWASVDPTFSRYNGQYIVYPNAGSGQPTGAFIRVVGLEVHEDNIYVMANEQYGNGAVHPIMMIFSTNGFFRGWVTYFPGGNSNKPGAGFTISGNKLIVLGDDFVPSDNPSQSRIWMSRYTIDANGGLSFDSSFGSGGFAFYRAYACTSVGSPAGCSTSAGYNAIKAQAGPTIPVSPKFYVAVSVKGPLQPDYNTAVLRFNGNGSRDTDFGYTSDGRDYAGVDFDDGGDKADLPFALETGYHIAIPFRYVDDIYVATLVSRSIQRGIGVTRFDGDGNRVSSFGSGGQILFGGCGSGAGNCNFSNVEVVPWTMVKDGNHLAIGGWYRGFNGAAVHFNYPLFAMVNSNSGVIENFSSYASAINGAVVNSTFYGLVANGDGSFTAAGDIQDAAAGPNLSYFSARLESKDVIFHNGFE